MTTVWWRLRSLGLVILVASLAACASSTPARPAAGPPTTGALDLQGDDPYFQEVRERIKRQWGYPCVANAATGECEHKTADLTLHFAILENGTLRTVTVVKSSGYEVYDSYAVNAVKLSSPFPPVPPRVMALTTAGSPGIVVNARFNYVVAGPSR
jgi:TonB family protein